MPDIEDIASKASMIINGYAFTREDDGRVRVVNLVPPMTAAVLDPSGRVLETSMDDLELGIVLAYYRNNREFLEVKHA